MTKPPCDHPTFSDFGGKFERQGRVRCAECGAALEYRVVSGGAAVPAYPKRAIDDPVQRGTTMSGPGTPSETPGHKALEDWQVEAIKEVREIGNLLENLCERLGKHELTDHRWAAMAKTHLQQGLMAATRSIAQPDFF